MPRTRSPVISQETKAQIICEARRPPPGSPQWSTRKMARAKGVSNHTVPQLWRAHDIKPHRKRTFKLSKDKAFEAKFWDVIGLCLDPPERALVLCCDEKSPCQALARTPPGLARGVGPVRTATHDYIRHGTLTLLAALSGLEGQTLSADCGVPHGRGSGGPSSKSSTRKRPPIGRCIGCSTTTPPTSTRR